MVDDRRQGDMRALWGAVVPFVEVAERSSFRRAAEVLGVSAAAVSKSVMRLEAQLGARLLARTSRSVRLTPEGEAFLTRAREAIAQLRAGRDEVEGRQRAPRGVVRISVSPILTQLALPELARLALRHEGLGFDLRVTDRIARLVEERVDVALRVGAPREPGFVARKLLDTRWQLVACPAYLARRGTPRRAEDLAQHDVLRFVPPSGKPRGLTLASGEVDLHGPLVVDQGELLLDAAREGMGIAQVLDFMARADLASGDLVELLESESCAGPAVHAVHVSGRRAAARVRVVVAHLVESFGRLG